MKKILNETDYTVLEYILKGSKVSRTELSEKLNISHAAISKIIKKLMQLNLLLESQTLSSSGGRPRQIIKFNEKFSKIIGINFGPGFIDSSVAYLDGTFIETKRKNFHFKDADKLKNLLTNEIAYHIEKYGKENFVGIGLAINGVVNSEDGSSIFSPHLKWHNLKLKEYFEKKFEVPVIVENDVKAMSKAELYNMKDKNIDNFLYLYLKDGIGASFVINGKVFKGLNNCSGELGHYVVNQNSNYKCKCGKYGCFEAEYSTSIIRDKIILELENKGLDFKNLTTLDMFEKASKGENPYYTVVKKMSFEIGKIIGNMLNIIDIGNVIISGDIINSKNVFFNNFEKGIDEMITKGFGNYVNIYQSEFEENVEKYGAIYLIKTNLFSGKKIIDI